MPDRTGIFLGWSANLSNFLGLGVEAGASPMYPQKMRVPPLGIQGTTTILLHVSMSEQEVLLSSKGRFQLWNFINQPNIWQASKMQQLALVEVHEFKLFPRVVSNKSTKYLANK